MTNCCFPSGFLQEIRISERLEANLGYVYENMIAQMLAASGNELFYHTFPKDAKHNYKIDFLLSKGKHICPIEVKSSGYRTHASLDAFCSKFAKRVSERYLIYTKDVQQNGKTILLPAYMTGLI